MHIDLVTIITTIITSAITAIVFSGGTNYILQKTNRKGNILMEQGFTLIDRLNHMVEERNNATFYCSFFEHREEDVQNEFRKYSYSCREFIQYVEKVDFIFNKKTRRELRKFIGHLTEVEKALESKLKGDTYSFYFTNNQQVEEIRASIIKQVKKQLV